MKTVPFQDASYSATWPATFCSYVIPLFAHLLKCAPVKLLYEQNVANVRENKEKLLKPENYSMWV